MLTLGQRLASLRKTKGISQSELAQLLNLGQSTIAMYETDKRQPDVATICSIANIFHVSIDYLLGKAQELNGNQPTPPHDLAKQKALDDPLLADLLNKMSELNTEEKEHLFVFWRWALQTIQKEREARQKK